MDFDTLDTPEYRICRWLFSLETGGLSQKFPERLLLLAFNLLLRLIWHSVYAPVLLELICSAPVLLYINAYAAFSLLSIRADSCDRDVCLIAMLWKTGLGCCLIWCSSLMPSSEVSILYCRYKKKCPRNTPAALHTNLSAGWEILEKSPPSYIEYDASKKDSNCFLLISLFLLQYTRLLF